MWVVVTLLAVTIQSVAATASNNCLKGINMPGSDLPGMPISTANSSACATQCGDHASCVLYTYHEAGCVDPRTSKGCDDTGGCCWLKTKGKSGIDPVISPCTCSGYKRMPPDNFTPSSKPAKTAKNVLYVLVDDLRPELTPYGQSYAHIPNFGKLAGGGTVFQNAYCNIAVCSPSRMSFLTGRRPDHSGIYNFINHFRQADCGHNKAHVEWNGEILRSFNATGQQCGWGGTTGAPCGGSGNCCTFCSAEKDCKCISLPS